MLKMPEEVYHQIRREGELAYPHECCGVLVGHAADRLVWRAIPCGNAAGATRSRYEIAPLDLVRILRQAQAEGLEIVGFYHSHPDHPAEPSAVDLAEAHWLGCSYVIAEIRDGEAGAMKSFCLEGVGEEDKRFGEEEICFRK